MARALTAYLKRDKVPERKPLQQAIDAFMFALRLDEAYAPFETRGYLPCTLDGEDAGFDLRFGTVPAEGSDAADLGGRDTTVSLKWSGDPREEAAALLVCAALVKRFDAVVHAGDGSTPLPLEQLLARAKASVA